MHAIQAYEYGLSHALLDILEETPGVTIYGLTDRQRLDERVPTVSFTSERLASAAGGGGAGQSWYLRLGRELLRVSCYRTAWIGRERRDGAGRTGAL